MMSIPTTVKFKRTSPVPLRESFLLRILGTMLRPFGSLLLVTVVAADCSADHCLRALKSNHGGIEAVREFCGIFTSNSQPAPAIPSYAVAACKGNQNGTLSIRLSSACECMAAATSSIAAASTSQAQSTNTTSFAATTTSTMTPPSTIAACAIVSSSWAAQFATAPGGLCIYHVTYFSLTFLETPTVAAQIAHDCLVTVPLAKKAALALVDAIEPYMEWQSGTYLLYHVTAILLISFRIPHIRRIPQQITFTPLTISLRIWLL